MDIYIFMDNNKILKKSSDFKPGKKNNIILEDLNSIKKSLRTVKEPSIVYVDISGMTEEKKKTVNYLSKKENIFFGIIDSTEQDSENINELYLSGAVDFINKPDINRIITEKRIKNITAYLNKYRTDFIKENLSDTSSKIEKKNYIISPNGWNSIVSGNDYTFIIMFIELDGIENMKKNYGKKNLQIALSTFRKYIEKNLEPFDGKIWMWSGFGGIILFPFDGQECKSLISGFRIILFKHIYDVEDSLFPHFISFRVAQHLGTITYKKNDTGNIISDNLNSIFHLGRIYAKPGYFYITEDILNYSPKPLKPYFIPSGIFENHKIYKMKKPAY